MITGTNVRAYHKGNVADDLRAAAKRILRTERLENVTLRRVTRDVGVTPANFYNHFVSIDELLSDISAAAFDEVTDHARAILSQARPRTDLLVSVATYFVDFCSRNKELARVMFRPPLDEHKVLQLAAQRFFALLIRFFQDEACGQDPPTAIALRYGIAFSFFALCYGLALTTADGLFGMAATNEIELAVLIESGIRPFLDGSIHALLVSKD